MEWLKETLTSAVLEVLAAVLLAALSLASAYAITYIKRAQARLEEQTRSDVLDRTIARAAALAESTVLSFESRFAKAIRAAIADGTATREELVALGEQAVKDVLAHLGTEGEKVLQEAVGDARDFVRDLVEAEVERLKRRLPEAAAKNS